MALRSVSVAGPYPGVPLAFASDWVQADMGWSGLDEGGGWGQAGALADRDPPVRAEIVHQSERTRVTRLFLPGRTFIGGADFTAGTGLAGLKDRVEAIGGRIFLESPRGAGTSLRVELLS